MASRRSASRSRLTAVLAGAAAAGLLALPGAASADVNSAFAMGELSITATAADAITVTVDAGNVKVNGGDPGGGTVAAAQVTSIVVTGGPGANDINLAAVNGAAFTTLASVSVNGGDGNDTINGSQLADLLTGGGGNDRIIGDDNPGGTRDDMRGGDDNDTLVWNPGDDDDLNEGGAGSDTAEVNGGGKEQFEVAPGQTAGRVAFDRVQPDPSFGAPFSVDISDDTERLDLNAGAGDDIVNAAAGLDALAFALDIDGGEGNDTIDGGDGPDLLSGGNGNDRIVADDNPAGTRDQSRGDAGDDTLVWNPGDDDDINEGGDGNDTVEVNGGGGGEQFTVTPSPTAGRVLFDRTGPTPPGPFNIDIGTSENLLLNAGGGDDRITGARKLIGLITSTFNGDDGDDTITGTDGADLISGGAGDDAIRSRDRAADEVDCGGGVDVAKVDKRDLVRDCDTVIGGRRRVRLLGAVHVGGGVVALRLRCAATRRCRGVVRLRSGTRTLGRARFRATRRRVKTVRVRLNPRGRSLLTRASGAGLRIRVQIDARDAAGNGWRTTARKRLRP
jgi:Ca2+-binding RTX toxin-like protein